MRLKVVIFYLFFTLSGPSLFVIWGFLCAIQGVSTLMSPSSPRIQKNFIDLFRLSSLNLLQHSLASFDELLASGLLQLLQGFSKENWQSEKVLIALTCCLLNIPRKVPIRIALYSAWNKNPRGGNSLTPVCPHSSHMRIVLSYFDPSVRHIQVSKLRSCFNFRTIYTTHNSL